MKKTLNKILMAATVLLCFIIIDGCKKVQLATSTTQDVNIYGYLQKYPDRYAEFTKIVDKSGYSGFLNAYGSYTLFAPTNEAVKAYLQETGKTSVDQLTVPEASDLVKLHLI